MSHLQVLQNWSGLVTLWVPFASFTTLIRVSNLGWQKSIVSIFTGTKLGFAAFLFAEVTENAWLSSRVYCRRTAHATMIKNIFHMLILTLAIIPEKSRVLLGPHLWQWRFSVTSTSSVSAFSTSTISISTLNDSPIASIHSQSLGICTLMFSMVFYAAVTLS